MLKHNQKYIVADFETESLNLWFAKPWQLAWLECQGNKVIKSHNRYLDWPDLQISPLVQKLTGFTWETYNQRKESPKKVIEDFQSFIYNPEYKLIGQNWIGYDCYILSSTQQKLDIQPKFDYLDRLYDTRPLGKAYRENITKPTSGNLLSWQYKLMHDRTLKAKVSQLAQLKHFDIDFEESRLHDADYDNRMCFQVFLKLKKGLDL